MVLVGKVNKQLISLISLAGATAAGLCGKDARLLTVCPSPDVVALRFVGEVMRVDPSVLHPIIASGHIPVIATVAADETGQAHNINADTAAGEIVAAIGAEKLLPITAVSGILADWDDPGSLLKEIDIAGVRQMVAEGKVGGGMIPKVECCVRALGLQATSPSRAEGVEVARQERSGGCCEAEEEGTRRHRASSGGGCSAAPPRSVRSSLSTHESETELVD